jgi:hypothetical protein
MNDNNQPAESSWQRFECARCVWYLVYLADADALLDQIGKESALQRGARRPFTAFEIKIDTQEWHSVSEHFGTFAQMAEQLAALYDATPSDDGEKILISVRLYYTLTEPPCRTMVLNLACHRCKVCDHNFKDTSPCDWLPLENPQSLHFACTTTGQSIENARQLQDHIAKLSQQHEGDGTFYAQMSVQRPNELPGQSLLKQAIRVARGQNATGEGVASSAVLHPPFQTFTTDRYALVPPGVVPGWKSGDPRFRQQAARPLNCLENEFDVDMRQNGSWYEQHFSGKASREQYFLGAAEVKGVTKRNIVDALHS